MEKNNIDYLRLSVTDRCNLNCVYCTPIEKDKFLTHNEILRYEEMVRLTRLFVQSGIKKVRVTGGEPLIKKGIIDLIKLLRKIDGLEELSLTTNGVRLKTLAQPLKDAGIDTINISLDTLKRERFKEITRFDFFDDVWQGLLKVFSLGFKSIKLNVIPMKGINEDEILGFVNLTLKYPITVRFIEFFSTNERTMKLANCLIDNSIIKEQIKNRFNQMTANTSSTADRPGPAQYYKIPHAKGLIGFINSSTGNFCNTCNRIRVDCAGKISPCLFSGYRYNINSLLKNNESDEKIIACIKKALESKGEYTKHIITDRKIEMSSVGG
ncbi:MAG: GTP 3',8-cyclase MoaA [Candidatus Omnitrophota bacterium]|nr:GTP 3',8-cyclase MoaA [Candidatus Omnitrophota bacterium]